MRRRLAIATALFAVLATSLALAGESSAHPLGNFSINHLTQVRVSSERVDALYILDQAEIPTFQERGLSSAEVLARKRAEVARRLTITVDGKPVSLRFAGPGTISFPPGQGGLRLTRVELPLFAPVQSARSIAVHDATFPDRVGWKAIVARPGRGTAVRSSAPADDVTRGLRTYPTKTLQSPLDERSAKLSVEPGDGTLDAPKSPYAGLETTTDRSGDGFAGVFADAASGKGVLALLLLLAFAWGALHALSPGHGKAMVAAYLIGTRGAARHAIGLGAIVTFTHTIGVFALGLVTLVLSQYILPENLYPWLNLAAGLLVVTVGLGVLRSRFRALTNERGHHRHDHHHHGNEHGHERGHEHEIPDRITWKGLAGMGAAAGLIPCPSALVVLLGAISQHQVGLGLVLIVAFSLGLAMTLTALGLIVVYAKRLTARVSLPSRLVTTLPALSALLIVGVGFVLTAQALPKLA
jgi:nickel/cobalt transporter (NicO) family protein